jgi:hypothetical protein
MGEDLFQTRISVKDDKPGIFFAAGYGQIIVSFLVRGSLTGLAA